MKRGKVVISLLISIILISSTVSFTIFSQNEATSYNMYVNNKSVGVVKYAAKGLVFYDNAMKHISQQYPDDANILSEVHFKEATENITEFTDESEIADAIGKAIEVLSPAYAILIEGDTICYVRTVEEAEQLTGYIKKPFIEAVESTGSQLQKVGFLEKVEFDLVNVDFQEIISVDEALPLLSQSSESVVEHLASSSDTLWDLAIKNNMKVEEIQALNPDLDPTKIKEGDTIVLSGEKKRLNVKTEEAQSYLEDIPFEVEEQEDNTLLRGSTKKVQEGKKGKKEIEALIVRENGIEIHREIIKETVLEEPVNEIVAIGTKKPVATPKPTQTPSRSGSTNSTPKPTKKPSSTPAPTKKPVESTPAPSKTDPTPAPTTKPESSVPSTSKGVTGQDIVDYAKKFEGYSYVYGGSGPKGFDCSGFTVYVYANFGIKVTRMNQVTNGTHVSKSDLKPGDILIFTKLGTSKINHVGLYIGNDLMIHASSPSTGVIISNINKGNYPARYHSARRIIN
ncbi:MAG: LysM peptidoglycan-binding domain-containing protein [Clostridiales bacterium]|nr:LysM peptidoglycan-binding domain-containing protein [Clostridiales bacterium]